MTERSQDDPTYFRVVNDDDGSIESEGTGAEYLDANPDDEETADFVRRAQVGESVRFGGGAAPIQTMVRVR